MDDLNVFLPHVKIVIIENYRKNKIIYAYNRTDSNLNKLITKFKASKILLINRTDSNFR